MSICSPTDDKLGQSTDDEKDDHVARCEELQDDGWKGRGGDGRLYGCIVVCILQAGPEMVSCPRVQDPSAGQNQPILA